MVRKESRLKKEEAVVHQALKCSSQLGVIGKFSRVVLSSSSLETIINQAADLLNNLNVSGILLVYRENNVAKASFGKGLGRQHVDEINTDVLSGDRVMVLDHTLVFNLPRMNLLITIDDMIPEDIGLFQDNLSIWFDTFDSVINAFCERQTLVREKEKLQLNLADDISEITNFMRDWDEKAAASTSKLFEDYICKVETVLPHFSLDFDQECKITELMYDFVSDFKSHLDKHLTYNTRLQSVLQTVYDELIKKGQMDKDLKNGIRISLDRRKLDAGAESVDLF